MKKKLTSLLFSLFLLNGLNCLSWLNGVTPAQANSELDRRYSLEHIAFLKAWDNIDGLFADYIANSYRDFFAKQSRFTLQELGRADQIMRKSSLSYQKVIEDPEILAQISKTLRVESLLRTRVFKEGPRYRIIIDWLLAPKMELIGSETVQIHEPNDPGKNEQKLDLNQIAPVVQAGLTKLLAKVPFVAQVTGRDDQTVTINIGRNANVGRGDVLIVSTLDEVKKHPLLHTVVDWVLTPVGRLEVDSVDQSMAFCKVVDEQPGREISKLHKIANIIPASLAKPKTQNPGIPAQNPTAGDGSPVSTPFASGTGESETTIDQDSPQQARLGWMSGTAWLGSNSRTYTNSAENPAVGKTSSGFLMGGKAEGQLWLNRQFFVDALFGYGSAGQTQSETDGTLPVNVGSVGVTQFRMGVGYTMLATPSFFGPKGWVKLGYQTMSYSMSPNTTNYTGKYSYSGLFLGLGGEIPLRDQYGLQLGLDIGLFPGLTETTTVSGTPDGETSLNVFFGVFYNYLPKIRLKIGMDLSAQGANFGTTGSISNKVLAFGPTVVVFF